MSGHGNVNKTKYLFAKYSKKIFLPYVTVNIYFVPQERKARTCVMPQGPNSGITCRIDLKLGENTSLDLADKIHFDSFMITHQGFISKSVPGA
jgi:hypothetical protein